MRRFSAVPLLTLAFLPIWTSGFVDGKLAVERVDLATTLVWRFAIAAALMWTLVAVTRSPLPRGRSWLHLGVVGLLLQVGQFGGLYLGLSHGLSAGLTSLVAGMAPLLVGLLGPLVLAEHGSRARVVGLVLGAVGVTIVISDDLGGGVAWSAVGFAVVGMLSLVAGTLYQKRVDDDAPLMATIAAQNSLSLLVTLPVLLLSGQQAHPESAGGWAAVVWLGAIPSCAGFAVFYLLLRLTSTVYVSSLLNLVPATTALVSVPVLGEPFTLRIAVGLAVALAGMYVGVVLPARAAARRTTSPPPEPCRREPARA